jgi:N6-L-threonylcarbamoyladenine synthase
MDTKPFHILGIETSCDETAAAVVSRSGSGVRVLSNVVSSQVALHARWGGVVPDLAAREHTKNIVPVVEEALRASGLAVRDIDALAVTQGPGLIPALLIGNVAAKTLAYVWKKPLVGIHHIEGHIYANFIRKEAPADRQAADGSEPRFPLLALVVSGGHTQLVLMRGHFEYEILGETQDDAAGEAFDKVAKMLGLPYPGGPVVARRADSFRMKALASGSVPTAEKFPRPMLKNGGFDFSFSGLKTAVLYSLKKEAPEKLQDETFVDSICYEFQEAVVDVLVTKTKRAIREFRPKTFVIAGGVSANITLRERLREMVDRHFPETTFATPDFAYSLDNAAMIAAAAAFRWAHMDEADRKHASGNWGIIKPDANLKLSTDPSAT